MFKISKWGFPSKGKVSSLEELERFLNVVGGFHDGIIKEMHWINRDFVYDDLSMRLFTFPVASVLVQRQWKKPSAVLITFDHLQSATLETDNIVFDSDCLQSEDFLILKIERSTFRFTSFSYEFKSEWMGLVSRLGSDSSPAIELLRALESPEDS